MNLSVDLPVDLPVNYGAEIEHLHTRLMRAPLAIDESYSYWQNCPLSLCALNPKKTKKINKVKIQPPLKPQQINQLAEIAFENRWFGSKSMARTLLLVKEFAHRYNGYPVAISVLQQWQPRDLVTRRNICHWHLQLVDPLYRAFSDQYLSQRRALAIDGREVMIDRHMVRQWVSQNMGKNWAAATVFRMSTGLITALAASGLCSDKIGERYLVYPQVSDLALEYWLYFLRGLNFEGTLLDNSYWRSVGLTGSLLENRLQRLPNINFRRMGELIDFGWQCVDLHDWALRLERERSEA